MKGKIGRKNYRIKLIPSTLFNTILVAANFNITLQVSKVSKFLTFENPVMVLN